MIIYDYSFPAVLKSAAAEGIARSMASVATAQRYDCVGLPLTCSCDEALRLYNKALFAYLSQRESPLPYISKACELDNTLVLAHCLLGNYWLYSHKSGGSTIAAHLEAVKSIDSSKITEREKGHVRAFLENTAGNLPQAVEEWSKILIHYPHDVLAIHHLFQHCMELGEYERERDCLARVMPHWKEEMKFYPIILAEYAFSLEQNNQRTYAEELSRKALSMDPWLPEAYHVLSHVIEEERDAAEGVKLLTSTRENWSKSIIGVHIAWHLALCYLDLGNTDGVFHELDSVLLEATFVEDLIDAVSLLWRMTLLGIEPGEKRWEHVTMKCTEYIGNHSFLMFDAHIMMCLSRGKVTESTSRLALAGQMVRSIENYAKSGAAENCKTAEILGLPVCNALLAFGKEQYDEVLSILLPLRYDLVRLGGSTSQRQAYSLTIIEAAIRANNVPLALSLVAELKAQKPKNKILTKLLEKLKSEYYKQKTLPCS